MSKLARSGRALGKNEKILLGVATIVGVTIIYWALVIGPALNKISPLEKEVKEYKAKLENTSMINSQIEQKEKTLKDLKVKYEEAAKVIPKTDRYPQLIKEIREMATKASLTIKSENLGQPVVYVQPGTEASTSNPSDPNAPKQDNTLLGLQTINLSLNVEGDFKNILAFIAELENDKRILDIQQISTTDKSTNLTLVYYIAGGVEDEEYDFNNGSYGKDNMFN